MRIQRFRLQRIVAEAVKITGKGEAVLLPDALQAANELFRTQIALLVIQPGFANGFELAPEPTADDIDRNTRVGQMADGGNLFGGEGWIPWARQQGGDDLELLRRSQQVL
ncbi:hypothetical protein D3C76_1242060 [compost metagenome]